MAEQHQKDAVWVAEEIKFVLPPDPAAQPTDVAGSPSTGSPVVVAAPTAGTQQATPANHTEPVKDKPAAGTNPNPTSGAANVAPASRAGTAPAPLPFSAKPATPLAPAK
jgi:hypothetical protein